MAAWRLFATVLPCIHSVAPLPLLISYAERDLLQMQVQAGELFARLTTGHGFEPELLCVRDHNHFSQTVAIGSGDSSVAGPLLDFIRRHASPDAGPRSP